MALRAYDTLTREKREFKPVDPGKVTMYVCGPTVYKPSHVGHMVGPVIFDTIKRYLTYLGYNVTFVVNITDVDDKLIVEAKNQSTTVTELAERVTSDYVEVLEALGVNSIDHMPRATHHIGDIIEIIQGLIDNGYAYPSEGDVYFDVTHDEDYGKLCNRDPEQLEAGTRIEVSSKKKNPGDFALWKAAKPGEPQWESPWGPGRPGWHIECSAMSMKLLGKTIDIHGGGIDLQFPHHENELAQSESFTGAPFVSHWMHNGLMRIRSQSQKIKDAAPTEGEDPGLEKMSKSLGNEIVVKEVLKKHDPSTLRYLLISTHYRSPIEYSEDKLQELRRAINGFYRFFERYERVTGESFYGLGAAATREESKAAAEKEDALWNETRNTFLGYMDDDFNTGGAVATLYELLNRLNRYADENGIEQNKDTERIGVWKQGAILLRELSQILGLFREPPASKAAGNDELVAGLMQLLIDLRANARKEKNFAVADQIRERLNELKITLEDRTDGTGWRVE